MDYGIVFPHTSVDHLKAGCREKGGEGAPSLAMSHEDSSRNESGQRRMMFIGVDCCIGYTLSECRGLSPYEAGGDDTMLPK